MPFQDISDLKSAHGKKLEEISDAVSRIHTEQSGREQEEAVSQACIQTLSRDIAALREQVNLVTRQVMTFS